MSYPYQNGFYQNPMQYGGYQPTMPNPYLDRVSSNYQQNFQQPTQQIPQQPQIQQTLNGRVVEDFNTISANDVPMDNSGAIFIKRDGSEIQIRSWGATGNIQTTIYKPILDQNNSQGINSTLNAENLKLGLSDEATGAIMTRFDDIASRLEKLEESVSVKRTRSKKETGEGEQMTL